MKTFREMKKLGLEPRTVYLGQESVWVRTEKGAIHQVWKTTKTKVYLIREYGGPKAVNPSEIVRL